MLSPDQIEARRGKLTGSRVSVLMRGDAAGIMRLYLEMIGQAEPEDLRDVWAVQLGLATEDLNLDWYERKAHTALTRRGEVVAHPIHDWAACTLDAWDDSLQCVVEAKHCGGREPLEVVIDRYQPQLQWQMEVTGAKQCALTVIFGANEPIVEYIERDADYAAEMVRRGAQFMWHVNNLTLPVVLPPVPSPVMATKTYDMTGQNRWADQAVIWLENRDAAERCRDAEKTLKGFCPEDAKKCTGHGVFITRDRAGRLSLRSGS
jgi:predicted phage-related endonuclease